MQKALGLLVVMVAVASICALEPNLQKRLESLVRQLGDEDFLVRKSAFKQLKSLLTKEKE